MVAAVGMGAFVAGMFHLVTHAFFKALLFLSAGSVILGVERGHHHLARGHHEMVPDDSHRREDHAQSQETLPSGHSEPVHEEEGEVFDANDMRNMGGMRKTMPTTYWLYMIGTLALAGIVPFAGFWSKDEILLDASLHYPMIYWILTIAAFLTAFYMGRQIWLVFFGEPRHEAAAHAEESPPVMTVPLMVLAFLSVVGGALNLPFEGFHHLGHWLEHTLHEVESLPLSLGVAGGTTALALIAIYVSWLMYGRNPLRTGEADPLKRRLGGVFTALENKWYVDELYHAIIVTPFVKGSQFLADVIDWRFWHDWFHEKVIAGTYIWISNIGLNLYFDQRGIDAIANNLGTVTQRLSVTLRKIQNGFVRSYALAVLVGVVAIVGYLILK